VPLYKTITVSASTIVYIWKIEEDFDTLSRNISLTDHCQNRVDGMKSELHKRGFMSVRHLLAEAGYTDHDLSYDALGKPHLIDNKHISITHSYIFSAIIVSDQPVGIDIEMQREKILRIANKFTTFEDYKTLANVDAVMRKLTIVWGAKESLYKLYAQEGLSFLKHIYVEDFYFDTGKTTGSVTFHGNPSQYQLDFLEFEGFTCVYALPA
jgi:phosphopantetheinyl transferase